MDPIIKIKNAVYAYPGQGEELPALRGISLEIEQGSFVAVIGHNGSGKSTLAKLFNGIIVPDSGSVTVDGMDTKDDEKLLDIRRTVGMVFQNPDNQLVASVVEDDVAFAPENLGYPQAEIRRRVDEALKAVDMYDYRLHSSHLLSGGQKQRVAIAGVIAMRPRCIVLDEPTAMLDPAGRLEVMDTVKRLCRESGITIILITHHMSEAVDADRIVVMTDGEIKAQGAPSEIFSRVEELKALGLTVPDTTELLYSLSLGGMKRLDYGALTADACAQAIAEALKQ